MAAEIPSSKDPIPTYRIDLSLPPSERYVQLGKEFAPKMQKITPLFDEVLRPAFPRRWMRRWIAWLAWLFLRRVYSAEETAEIKGLSKAAGVDMYFLVALNVLLDSMLGCTSGAVMTSPKGSKRGKVGEEDKRMMHFRTLDWGMDPLRSVLVVLEFVRSKSEEPEKVIGRSITYAGFVGILTGVKQELSISLNFRPNHECSTFKLRLYQLLVLFGFRPSISHIIRSTIFPPVKTAAVPLEELAVTMSKKQTAPCYLILCDGTSSTVLEKDLLNAKIRTSDEFIVHTNNDTTPALEPAKPLHDADGHPAVLNILDEMGLDAFIKDSKERSACVQKKWNALKGRQRRKQQAQLVEEKDMVSLYVREETLVGWVRKYPTMNGQSHFGCVMDPKKGDIRWLERGACWLSEESLTMAEDDQDVVIVSD
ncbi:uncharacterized protein LY89DRAFT_574468 [Mollisia scopiformis]|uniref:ceramidase n=1 Tax=Mollisia scopiformis TaxID=149040 RepID=A0A194XTT3_MOLSC|nr:uncharacterized protein LY89DRAFT_574468 [Mollisia scopiformis]KUJ23449.1 hypothetical protein LY89DRAFT_574468 [Mollisia scopiformis]